MANFGPLTGEINWRVWGTLANFNRFCIFPSLLQRRGSLKANQTLHFVWPSPGLVHYIHFRGLLPLAEYCPVQNWLYLQVLRSPILAALYCTTLQQRASAKLRGVQQRAPPIFSRWPSRWASAHILVQFQCQRCFTHSSWLKNIVSYWLLAVLTLIL